MGQALIGVAVLLLAGQAGAQTAAGGGTALRAGEVALHIVAHGETTSRADRIELPVSVTGRGTTAALARAAADASVGQIIAALVAAGVDRAAIASQAPVGVHSGLVTVDTMAGVAAGGARQPSHSESVSLTVTLADRAMLDRVRQVLATQESARVEAPRPSLRDEASARRAAVASAIDHARHEADDYAAPLGLRVARVTAVSNAAGIGDGVAELTEVFNRFQGHDKAPDSVTTRATAVVDFVLTAR